MSALPPRCVLDASVLVKYLVPEAETPAIEEWLTAQLLQRSPCLAVPDLIFIECANVLWKKMRRGEVEPADADGDLEDLAELRLTVTPTARLMRAALHLAWTYRISAYDACYVALARELGVPLLTADERLASALKECTVEVLRLTECLRGE